MARQHGNDPQHALIEIPAQEFTNLPATPPPARLAKRVDLSRTTEWQHRQNEAAAVRNATLDAMRHRCREHIEHVTSVVQGMKEMRRLDSAARHAELHRSLVEAEERRRELLRKRGEEKVDSRVRRARLLRERSQQRRKSLSESARDVREEAQVRRGRYLSERRERAARFSPTRTRGHSPSSSSPDRMSFPDSPSSMSCVSRDDTDEDMPGTSSNVRSSSSFESSEYLPSAVADSRRSRKEGGGFRARMAEEVQKENEQRMLAARKISCYYLLSKARKGLRDSGALGSRLASYSFEEVTACLENEKVQRAADMVFRVLGLRERQRNRDGKDIAREQMERRVLLSCLLVALHPEAVLEQKTRRAPAAGEADSTESIDSAVIFTARRMLLSLHVGTVGAIASAWVMWRRSFIRWKNTDAQNLLNAMIEDAIATEALRAAINKKFSLSSDIFDLRSSFGVDKSVLDASRQEHLVWEEQISLKQDKIREAVIKLAGASGANRLDAALAASRHVQDEILVHEILVDLPSLLEKVQRSTPELDNEWDRLRKELSQEKPERTELLVRLAKISNGLNSMRAGSFSLDDFESPVDLGIEFAVSVVARAGVALKSCQAEAYDDALDQWIDSSIAKLHSSGIGFVDATVSVLRELTELVRRVQADVLTYRIQHSAPIVKQYGVAWERSHFQGHIVSGTFAKSLPRTTQMLRDTLISDQALLGSAGGEFRLDSAKATRELLILAISRLALKIDACTESNLPEILYLDLSRIVKMQSDIQKITLLATLDSIGRQFLRTVGMSQSADDLRDLWQTLNDDSSVLRSVQDSFVSWIQSSMRRDGKELSNADASLLHGMVERSAQRGDRAFTLIQSRVHAAIVGVARRRGHSSATSASTSSQLSGASQGPNVRNGLESVEANIADVGRRISALAAHIVAVHGAAVSNLAKNL